MITLPCGERLLLILYATETGCAQEIAELMAREARRRHFLVRLRCTSDYDVVTETV